MSGLKHSFDRPFETYHRPLFGHQIARACSAFIVLQVRVSIENSDVGHTKALCLGQDILVIDFRENWDCPVSRHRVIGSALGSQMCVRRLSGASTLLDRAELPRTSGILKSLLFPVNIPCRPGLL